MNPYDGPDGDDPGPGEDFDTDMITINPPRWQRWRPGRPVAVAGVALVALAGGAGVGFAATHSTAKPAANASTVSDAATPTPTPSPVAPKPGSHFGHGFRFGGAFPFGGGPFGMAGAGGVVHGQFTVPKSGGGYQTLDVQMGTVTSVNATSITVKSADGYSLTYTVTSKTLVDAQAAGIGSVKKGDSVFVTATVSGSTPTAANISDLTALKAGHASFFPAPPGNPGNPGNPGQSKQVQLPIQGQSA